jgi:hypothetical protein
MPDYYTVLVRKIREAESDSAKLREIVYEAARLALKRQVYVYYPPISHQAGKRLIGDLEAAIERLETDAGGHVRRPSADPAWNKTAPVSAPNDGAHQEGFDRGAPAAGDPEHDAIRSQPKYDPIGRPLGPLISLQVGKRLVDELEAAMQRLATNTGGTEERYSSVLPSNKTGVAGRVDPGALADSDEDQELMRPRGDLILPPDRPFGEPDNTPVSRDLVLVPDHRIPASRGANYLVRPDEFPARHRPYYRDPPEPTKSLRRKILIGAGIGSQIVIVILAGASFYAAIWMRAVPPPALPDFAAATPYPPARVLSLVRPAESIDPAAVGSIASAPAFPRPTSYGVYAISDNRLTELEPIPTAPVDPRVRNSHQIVKPSHTVISDSKLAFIVYRRDLTTSAPEKVPVRIAARIARSMTFDTNGKPVTVAPPVDTWLVREQGYDLRVSPTRESSEMVMLLPESDEFAFPPGRYELLLGAQFYDFVIAGTITDPAHCVEGVATARGPAFYECRTR